MRELTLSIPERNLFNLVERQLSFHYPDQHEINTKTLQHCIENAIRRIRKCFDHISLKYYVQGNNSYFNHLHGDHYASFLYLASNEAYLAGDEILASKLFLLNKCFFGIDAFYAINLPVHFLFVHPLGTVLGNAKYDNFFVVYQGVTIGSTNKGEYPVFSSSTILYSNSSIIGNCYTGKNFVLGANASLVNTNIPDNKVVVGKFPVHSVLENKNNLISGYFKF
jgi:serine O-acetyltransferase